MPTVDELINFALDQQPTKFASVFDSIMGEKAAEAIDSMRTTVAQGIYNDAEEDTTSDEDDFDADDIDDLLDDELNLDDEELQEFEDDGENA